METHTDATGKQRTIGLILARSNPTRCRMMNMNGMGWMMSGGAVIGILIIVLLIVGIAAGVKYLRTGRQQPPKV